MNSTSSLYNSIYSGIHRFEVKVNIAGTDYGMNVLTSLNSRRSVFGSGSPRLGLAPAGELSLSLYLDSGSVPRMAEIRPYFRVVNDSRQSEWIAKGVYYVDTREADTTTGLLTLHAYDAMLKGEVKYPSTSHTWPYSDLNVVTEIASFLGVTVDAQTTDLMTAGFMIPLPAQYTLRETLQYIAALYGGSFVLTDANTLRLVCLWNRKTEADLTLGSTHRLTESPAFPACTGVRFLLDDDSKSSSPGMRPAMFMRSPAPLRRRQRRIACSPRCRASSTGPSPPRPPSSTRPVSWGYHSVSGRSLHLPLRPLLFGSGLRLPLRRLGLRPGG